MVARTGTTSRRLALVAAAVGAVLVVACLAGSIWPRLAGEPVPRSWSGETLYLRADGREDVRCTVAPPEGPARAVTVPGTPGRGLKLLGERLEPSFDGAATITCPPSVTATRGPILLVYPLAENDPWVILPAAVLLAAGWIHSRPRRA